MGGPGLVYTHPTLASHARYVVIVPMYSSRGVSGWITFPKSPRPTNDKSQDLNREGDPTLGA